MLRSGVLPVFAAVAVLSVVGCGPSNGGDTTAEDYAKSVCSTLLAWKQGVANDSAVLSRELRAASFDAATVKSKYTAFFQRVVDRTDTLVRGVAAAGAPKVDKGVDYARDLRAALAETRTGLAAAHARFAALPAGDLRSYAAGAATIRDQLGRVFVGVGTALDRLRRTYTDKALNSAFNQQADCKSLA